MFLVAASQRMMGSLGGGWVVLSPLNRPTTHELGAVPFAASANECLRSGRLKPLGLPPLDGPWPNPNTFWQASDSDSGGIQVI